MEWAYVYYKSNKKGKKIHVLYAVGRVAFPQKTIHMGCHHTNRQLSKFTETEIKVGFYVLCTLKNR
jgi:hypothetical protein